MKDSSLFWEKFYLSSVPKVDRFPKAVSNARGNEEIDAAEVMPTTKCFWGEAYTHFQNMITRKRLANLSLEFFEKESQRSHNLLYFHTSPSCYTSEKVIVARSKNLKSIFRCLQAKGEYL